MDRIDEVIALEWEMFQAVNAGGPRADCQNNPGTFDGMRRGQFLAWDEPTLHSYYRDLLAAKQTGRNLIAEKYIRMMEHTDPDGYRRLQRLLPELNERQKELVNAITQALIRQTEDLFSAFPCVAGAGRPLYSEQDSRWVTSVETYQRGELFTYSEQTLEALHAYLLRLEEEGTALARLILENSVKHYGYSCLEEAEAHTARSSGR